MVDCCNFSSVYSHRLIAVVHLYLPLARMGQGLHGVTSFQKSVRMHDCFILVAVDCFLVLPSHLCNCYFPSLLLNRLSVVVFPLPLHPLSKNQVRMHDCTPWLQLIVFSHFFTFVQLFFFFCACTLHRLNAATFLCFSHRLIVVIFPLCACITCHGLHSTNCRSYLLLEIKVRTMIVSPCCSWLFFPTYFLHACTFFSFLLAKHVTCAMGLHCTVALNLEFEVRMHDCPPYCGWLLLLFLYFLHTCAIVFSCYDYAVCCTDWLLQFLNVFSHRFIVVISSPFWKSRWGCMIVSPFCIDFFHTSFTLAQMLFPLPIVKCSIAPFPSGSRD